VRPRPLTTSAQEAASASPDARANHAIIWPSESTSDVSRVHIALFQYVKYYLKHAWECCITYKTRRVAECFICDKTRLPLLTVPHLLTLLKNSFKFQFLWMMQKFRGAVLAKRAICCPHAAPAMFGQRGQLLLLPRGSGAPVYTLNYSAFLGCAIFIFINNKLILQTCHHRRWHIPLLFILTNLVFDFKNWKEFSFSGKWESGNPDMLWGWRVCISRRPYCIINVIPH
jgi:hypothetical protein